MNREAIPSIFLKTFTVTKFVYGGAKVKIFFISANCQKKFLGFSDF